MLEIANLGARDYYDAGDRRMAGLYNAVTNGRSVTFVIQKLRGRAAGFDEWYEGVVAALQADEVGRWFVKLRNRIEKEGSLGEVSTYGELHRLDDDLITRLFAHAPPNTAGIFFGDEWGRSGWDVRLVDGTRVPVFFQLPMGIGFSTINIADAPGGRSVEELLPGWLQSMDDLVTNAERLFKE
jgi:hypothetical protein